MLGELELGWRLRAERGDRDHGLERQDDDDRAGRPDPPRGRRAGRGRRQRRHGAQLAGRAGSTRPPSSSARRRRSSSRTRSRSPRTPRCCSTSRPTTSTATARSRRTATRSCGSSPTRTRDAIAVAPAGLDHGGAARRIEFESPMGGGDAAAAGRARRRRTARRRRRRGRAARRPISSSATGGSSGAATRSIAVDEIRLRGAHNLENAMAAAAVTLARGIDPGAVRAGLAGFAGVAHRLEEVARIDGVLYVDDSKATNVASAVVGIRSFPGGVHAILGGRGKGEDYAPLAAAVAERCSGRVPDRRGGAAAAARRSRRPASPSATAATSSAPSPRRARRRGRATSCCCRPPAPPTTSTARSRSAARTSRRWCAAEPRGRPRALSRGPRRAAPARGARRREASGSSCRIPL